MTTRPPVLMYHIVDDHNCSKISVGIRQFYEHIHYLNDSGYTTLSLREYIDIAVGKITARSKSVLITFDDGYIDALTNVAPEMQKLNFRATIFLITGHMGEINWWNRKACFLKSHLSWDEAKILQSFGWDIGSHTVEHHCLVKLNDVLIEEEMALSKRMIEYSLNTQVDALAYPYGEFNDNVAEIARKYYKVAFSVDQGIYQQPDLFNVNRLSINRRWDIKKLEANINITG